MSDSDEALDINHDTRRLFEVRDQRYEKRECEDSLIEFFKCAWPHMGEPGELVINWHHVEIANVLEAQAYGEIQNVAINQPPRTSKSSLASVALPAWCWIQPEDRWGWLLGPHVQFFCVSYAARLAEEIALKQKRLVMSPWFIEHWGKQVEIRDDQSSRANFGTTAGGGRISSSIEGGLIGRGGIWQLVDDAHDTKGAESEVQRRETLEAMRSLTTRINNPKYGARTLIGHRMHIDDATNYVLENWRRPIKHIMFPMRYDSARAIPEDPRTCDGELLWPEVWDEASVRQEEKELGEYGTASQLQQSPVPRGGGIIKRAWWRLWPDDAMKEGGYLAQYRCTCGWEQEIEPAGPWIECRMCGKPAERVINFPDTSYRILSVDTALSEEDQVKNSWNAATRWGIWHSGPSDAPRVMLMEAWRGRPPLLGGLSGEKGLVEQIHMMAVRGRVDLVLIEKKTRGVDLYRELARLMRIPEEPEADIMDAAVGRVQQEIEMRQWRSRNPFAKPSQVARQEFRLSRRQPFQLAYFEPTGRGDKVARLHAVSGLFTSDIVWAPDKKWADMVIDEVCSAGPRAQFMDLCDTVTAAMLTLRDMGLLMLGYEHEAERRREQVYRSAADRSSIRDQYEEA